ncbi:unnamed protein product [Agarophyton chilense]|eukprot:gb/GEZJ01002547.1/.p2 GENE.gb/GEZJ01002547.1/~~gb/GEZJ01002547.1/.p2  ORF type:complete len:299 (-),score=73.85 gb/GEZJ01002547.1/:2594-3490(-)
MSSVRDRIRNLQAAKSAAEEDVSAAARVHTRAQEVERALSEGNDAAHAKSLSQLTSRFDRAPDELDAGGRALSSRVAQFDARNGADSVHNRTKRLENEQNTTGLVGRALPFRKEGSVGEAAARFAEREQPAAAEGVLKAKAKFEAAPRAAEGAGRVATVVGALKEDNSQTKTAQQQKNITNRASIFEKAQEKPPVLAKHTPSLMSFGSDDSAVAAKEAIDRRAAVFEKHSKDEPVVSAKENKPNAADVKEKSVHDQLREVKRANEQLLSTLLKLTASFKALESTRDDLQQRITELENK